MALKASIQKQREGELLVIYLYIPREGLSPMLLLEYKEDYNLSFRICKDPLKNRDDRFFKIHINDTEIGIKNVMNFINNNL